MQTNDATELRYRLESIEKQLTGIKRLQWWFFGLLTFLIFSFAVVAGGNAQADTIADCAIKSLSEGGKVTECSKKLMELEGETGAGLDKECQTILNTFFQDCISEVQDSEAQEPPTDEAPNSIRARILESCKREWGNEYSMVKFCADQGIEAYRSVNRIDPAFREIVEKCKREWPDDFTMIDFCAQQEITAFKELQDW